MVKEKIFKIGFLGLGGFLSLVGLETVLLANGGGLSVDPMIAYAGIGGGLAATFLGVHFIVSTISSLRRAGWGCDCPLCRVTAAPIADRLSGPRARPVAVKLGEASEGVEGGADVPEAPAAEAGVVAVQEQQPLPQPVQPQINLEEVVAPLITPINEAVQTVQDKISTIEEEIERVKEQLKSNMDEIKESLINLRATITESKNPFKELGGEGAGEDRQLGNPGNPGDEGRLENPGGNPRGNPGGKNSLRASHYIRVARWVDRMLNKMSKSLLMELLKGYVEVGMVDEDTGRFLLKMVDVVDRLRNSGLSVGEQALSIYSLSRILEEEGGDALEELLETLEEAGPR